MKSKKSILCAVWLLVAVVSLVAQTAPEKEVFVLETFNQGENVRDWKVVGSQFAKEGFPKVTLPGMSACSALETEEGKPAPAIYPDALAKEDDESNSKQRVLGVYSEFTQKGRNRIEIISTSVGTVENSPIYFNGVVDTIGLWVWGGNFNYSLDLCVKDLNENIHRLPVGMLNFIGWKYFEVKMPHFIPQQRRTLPATAPLQFVKFIVNSAKDETNRAFYLYIDDITYTGKDPNDLDFDGNEFIDADVIEAIWDSSSSSEENNEVETVEEGM